MNKTSRRLSDGREVIYYDGPPFPERNAVDGRDLAPLKVSSSLRYNHLLGAWVMYASHRQDRTYLPTADDCPLCPTKPGHPTEIPESAYQVAVFENRFPSLVGARREVDPRAAPAAARGLTSTWSATPGLLGERASGGRCEVVCFTDDHDGSFAQLSPERVGLVLSALVDRTQELSAMEGVEQVFCFENRGREIGVTQPHPHGQIYAYPFVTPRTEKMLESARAYRERYGGNLFDDMLEAEREDGRRVVTASARWTAFVPHAARWPYEVHCYPNDRAPDLAGLSEPARDELPAVLLDVFGRFAQLFDEPAPYIAGWHQAPTHAGRDELAVHLEMFTVRRTSDKLKFLAGSESAMDAFANDVVPEAAAERLREVGA
ncbi:MAG TPA: galactose-1-phosphate uridylyltransferase [Acidimicrobiales bacterium]|nr:galactose-1-phosphate uridylyltransferase [Acidimicrobiales bacterium]